MRSASWQGAGTMWHRLHAHWQVWKSSLSRDTHMIFEWQGEMERSSCKIPISGTSLGAQSPCQSLAPSSWPSWQISSCAMRANIYQGRLGSCWQILIWRLVRVWSTLGHKLQPDQQHPWTTWRSTRQRTLRNNPQKPSVWPRCSRRSIYKITPTSNLSFCFRQTDII